MGKGLESRVAGLKGWRREELVAEWQCIRGSRPPKSTSPQFMARVISYYWQQEELGGLSVEARRLLADMVRRYQKDPQQFVPERTIIKPGTKLQRLWQGKMHEVIVMHDGSFNYSGKKYGSLSEVARLITGSRWNGHAFFGLRKGRGARTVQEAA